MSGNWRRMVGILMALGTVSLGAQARVQTEAGYTKLQAYNGALRFIRIDRGFPVTEKDQENGYLLFEYKSSPDAEPSMGSVEVIDKDDGVAVVVQLPQMPEHHERHLADGLLAKLRSDYGEPPARKPASDRTKKGKSTEEKPAPREEDSKEPRAPGDSTKDKKSGTSNKERVPGYRIQ